MIIEHTVGERIIEPTDTLLPYHARPEWAERVKKEMVNLTEYFHLKNLDQMTTSAGRKRPHEITPEKTQSKVAKEDLSLMDTREVAEKGMLDKLTVVQLRAAIAQHIACTVKQGTKKAEMVEMLKKYFRV
ncbi:hypothetical protein KIN20_027835 [Parelaphostrongylus tenuis]|uniref:ATP-dependent DNA helicase 2 subunit 1 n=1 Tax=Parelaphostrongylus tenuis TaxID=148309 RepID=A0AAD5R000_PARTN|nr:hypothetical protein KIN20_027835 [Parelaphostrongylus tenuis]